MSSDYNDLRNTVYGIVEGSRVKDLASILKLTKALNIFKCNPLGIHEVATIAHTIYYKNITF